MRSNRIETSKRMSQAPARACAESRLASPDFLVEIAVIAAV